MFYFSVRSAKFVPRKQWVVCGADDMFIRVYNYNTMDRVKTFEAHTDYIRSLAIHPNLPYMISSSDDMLIKLWDWDKVAQPLSFISFFPSLSIPANNLWCRCTVCHFVASFFGRNLNLRCCFRAGLAHKSSRAIPTMSCRYPHSPRSLLIFHNLSS